MRLLLNKLEGDLRAIVLVRILVGWVFVSEGIQKFLFPDALGVGRFIKIGIPWPEFMAPFVGVVEIVCGSLLLLGLLTLWAAIPLTINMAVAIITTKIPVLWGTSAILPNAHGFWGFAHEVRVDFCMFLGSIFLLWVGPGPWSLDNKRFFRKTPQTRREDRGCGA
jgi:putative oxidoreductase